MIEFHWCWRTRVWAGDQWRIYQSLNGGWHRRPFFVSPCFPWFVFEDQSVVAAREVLTYLVFLLFIKLIIRRWVWFVLADSLWFTIQLENLTRFVPFVQTCPFVRALLRGESLWPEAIFEKKSCFRHNRNYDRVVTDRSGVGHHHVLYLCNVQFKPRSHGAMLTE